MTYSPQSYLDIRALFRAKTGLPPEDLGIQHYAPEGGGYHEGIDLLKQAGRYLGQDHPDYSVRESPRDQPGTDGANAIDIAWFDVTLANGRRVTLRDLTRWLLAHINDPDALWIREIIYSLDGRTVQRYDRLGVRTTGDDSHLTHDHISGFRDDENVPKAPLFQRFWAEMEGSTPPSSKEVDMIQVQNGATIVLTDWATWCDRSMNVTQLDALSAAGVGRVSVNTPTVERILKLPQPPLGAMSDLATKLDAFAAEWAGEKTRDAATTAALDALRQQIATGGGDVDVAAILARVNEVAEDDTAEFAALRAELRDAHDEIGRLRLALAAAERASAAMLDPGPTPTP